MFVFFFPECNQTLQNPFFQFFCKGKICKSPRKVSRKPSEIKSNKRAREKKEKVRKVYAKCRPNVHYGAESVKELQYKSKINTSINKNLCNTVRSDYKIPGH